MSTGILVKNYPSAKTQVKQYGKADNLLHLHKRKAPIAGTLPQTKVCHNELFSFEFIVTLLYLRSVMLGSLTFVQLNPEALLCPPAWHALFLLVGGRELSPRNSA